jgi:hypothetical protein
MEDAVQKIDAFFNPQSVAVIGATKKLDKEGHVIFKSFATNKKRAFSKENSTRLIQRGLHFRFRMLSHSNEINGPID